MNGHLIVIDGLDGSGKTTQSDRIADRLRARGEQVLLISFPDYKEPSSALVRMYLDGEFSQNPDEVNPYAASSFYAVDRFASFKKFWEQQYKNGTTILATRYVSSNAVHQMCKLPQSEWQHYLDWLDDYEYEKLGLPRPDTVIFLDMKREVADRLIQSRYHGDESKKDIHEKNMKYLAACQQTAAYSAEKQNWQVIPCDDGENPLPLETVTERIMQAILKSRSKK